MSRKLGSDGLAWPWLAPAAAFVGYGAWSCWVNAGSDKWWIAGFVQGSYALLSTIVMRTAVIALSTRLRAVRGGDLLSFAITAGLLATIPTLLHATAGTAEIIRSILPGLLIGAAYAAAILRAQANQHAWRR